MNYLNLNSARTILETVATNNGSLTWYNIVKTVDQAEEVRSLSNNPEFLEYLDRCRQRAKTEGTLSLSEVRRRLSQSNV